jgi:hypothetical protein
LGILVVAAVAAVLDNALKADIQKDILPAPHQPQ